MTLTASPHTDNSWRIDAIAGLLVGAAEEGADDKASGESEPQGDGRGG